MKSLPNKPSALILLALKDLRETERLKKYVVDMGIWHEPIDEGKCLVCLAGSVMCRTLKASPDRHLDPEDFGSKNSVKLRALDHLRSGQISQALDSLGLDPPDLIQSEIDITPYEDDPDDFKADMKQLALNLKKLGF